MGEVDVGGRLGLVAGDGDLPRLVARALAATGELVGAVAFHDLSDAALERELSPVRWHALSELDAAVDSLRAFGARRLVLVGGLPKRALFGVREGNAGNGALAALVARAADLSDDALFRALAGWLEVQGFGIARQDVVLAPLLAKEGAFSRRAPSDAERSDVEYGRRALAAVGAAGIGQCVVVRRGCVVAVEAAEGTDETIRRAGRIAGPGCVVVKGARAGQDPRFDLPAVGPGTIAAMAEARASCLAVEAGVTLLLDAAALADAADRVDIACIAWPAPSLKGPREYDAGRRAT